MTMFKIQSRFLNIINHSTHKPFFYKKFLLFVFFERSAFEFHTRNRKISIGIAVLVIAKIDFFYHFAQTTFALATLIVVRGKITQCMT